MNIRDRQPAPHPADALAEEMRALHRNFPYLYALDRRPPASVTGPDWVRPVDALREMLGRAGPHLSVSPAVSAARVTNSLAYAVIGRPGVGLALAGMVPDLETLTLRLNADGFVQQAAITGDRVMVAAGHPFADHLDAVVCRDQDALISWTAACAFSILAPVLDDLHHRTRFGLVPMWNLVADSALGPLTVTPLLAGHSQQTGRAVAIALVDSLVALGAPIRRRGGTQSVMLGGAEVLAPVRGSCCLIYRDAGTGPEPHSRPRAQPASDTLCASCPLLDPGYRARRFAQTLA